VPVVTPKNPSTAFLWIPAEAKQVRGLLAAGMTLMEREFAKDSAIRKVCVDEGLGMLFFKCGLNDVDLPRVLNDLARVSGYRELPMAPLMFVGHSAGGPQAKALAIKMADRCFGLVLYRGGVPGGDESVPPGVPVLMMIGQFDEFGGTMRNPSGRETWEGGRDAIAEFRAKDPRNLASVVVEPGAGHFAWSDRNAAYLALFVRKAAGARIPDWRMDAKQPVHCKSVDPENGWLSDLTTGTMYSWSAAGQSAPAPYGQYSGDKTHAAWHFDREIAEATVAYHARGFGKKDQFIRWKDPFNVDAGARYFFSNIQWIGDGQTFEVHPFYADQYPVPHASGGPRWSDAGKPAGHSTAAMLVKPVSGPLVAVSANSFRIRYDGLAPATEAARPTFMAFSAGDAEYRYTEQVGMLPKGFSGLKSGKTQTITFPPISNLKAKSGPVKLAATSDAGLPVEYYVAYGPAEVADGKLSIAELPLRATFPITVKVVACQFGRGVEPLVQTARPVEQTIQIEKP
ncbi:MAG: hypothetical protein ABSG68_24730, partial [Thermoguttaceae bacterium]